MPAWRAPGSPPRTSMAPTARRAKPWCGAGSGMRWRCWPWPSPFCARRPSGEEEDRLVFRQLFQQLTERARDILRLVAGGLSNKAPADRLSRSGNTVKWHMRSIFETLHVVNSARTATEGRTARRRGRCRARPPRVRPRPATDAVHLTGLAAAPRASVAATGQLATAFALIRMNARAPVRTRGLRPPLPKQC